MSKDWVKLFKLTTFGSTNLTCDVSTKDWNVAKGNEHLPVRHPLDVC